MTSYLKKIIFFIENRTPLIGKSLIKFLRWCRFYFFYKPYIVFNQLKKEEGFDNNIFTIFWIDPQTIKYNFQFSDKELNLTKDRGTILDGDWDLSKSKFEDTITYKAFAEKFIDGKKWNETELYKEGIKQINQGKLFYGCNNKEKLGKYFQYIDDLYESIKRNKYLPNNEVKNFKTEYLKTDPYSQKIDEIDVAIGRNGEVLFVDGRHRLAIAKILKIEKVSVTVFLRHKKWVKTKNKFYSYAKQLGGKLYQQAYHFDLKDLPYSYGEERFFIIEKNLNEPKGTLLDIGANLGFFSYKFEKIGYKCLAIDVNPQEVHFMKILKKANDCDFEIIKESIFNLYKYQELRFDVVLALNIFHHFLKRESEFGKLKDFLKKLSCKTMFFETHNPAEKQMKDSYQNFESEEFVKFIIDNSSLNDYSLLKEFNDGRKLYKIFC